MSSKSSKEMAGGGNEAKSPRGDKGTIREKGCVCEFCPQGKNKYVSLMRHWRYVPSYDKDGNITNQPSACASKAMRKLKETKDSKYDWTKNSNQSKNSPVAGHIGLMRAVVALERAGIIIPKAATKLRELITAKFPNVSLSSSASQAGDIEELDDDLCDDRELTPEEEAAIGDI
jgi:hypothetical protein